MIDLMRRLTRRMSGGEGQALAEYALIVAFIALACVLALTALGLATSGSYTGIIGSF